MASTRHSAEGTVNRGLSPVIWQEHFLGKIQNDPSRIGFFFDDFADAGNWADGDTVKYAVHIDSTGTIVADPTVDLSEGEFGVLRFTTDGTEHDQLSIQMGGNVGNLVKIDDAAGEDGVVAFECRVKVATITTGDLRLFFGLAEAASSADNRVLTDTADTFGNYDYLGFWVKETDGASLFRAFKRTSGTLDEEDTGHDLVLNTWIKLGLLYDPDEAADKRIRFFVDGAECTDKDTRCDATDLADDTNFPAGEEMAPIILLKCGAGTAGTDYLHLDWLAVGQVFTEE